VFGVESGAGSTPHCLHFFVVLAHFAWLARGLDDFALHGASTTLAPLLFGKTRWLPLLFFFFARVLSVWLRAFYQNSSRIGPLGSSGRLAIYSLVACACVLDCSFARTS